jgi:hypothetical protein
VRRTQFTKGTRRGLSDFEPFFDWGGEDDSPSVGLIPAEDLTERIFKACEAWQGKGGVLVRSHFGVKTVRVKREGSGRLTGFYETQKYCCPLAPFLDGLPSRFNPLADFASVLAVDHFWVLGFIHGFDKTEWFTGRREEDLKESLSYVDGLEAGRKVGERFYVIDIGWEGKG